MDGLTSMRCFGFVTLCTDDISSVMVRAQMLSELEEIIAYKQYADQPERQATMKKTWMKRSADTCMPNTSANTLLQTEGVST